MQQSRACLPIVHWPRIISIVVLKTAGDLGMQIATDRKEVNLCVPSILNRYRRSMYFTEKERKVVSEPVCTVKKWHRTVWKRGRLGFSINGWFVAGCRRSADRKMWRCIHIFHGESITRKCMERNVCVILSSSHSFEMWFASRKKKTVIRTEYLQVLFH